MFANSNQQHDIDQRLSINLLHCSRSIKMVKFCFNGIGPTYLRSSNGAFPLHGTVRFGTARYGTVHFGSVAFPPQFSTAIEWAGLFTRRYNCAASTAVTSS